MFRSSVTGRGNKGANFFQKRSPSYKGKFEATYRQPARI